MTHNQVEKPQNLSILPDFHPDFFLQQRVHMRGLWLTCNILPKENKFGMGAENQFKRNTEI